MGIIKASSFTDTDGKVKSYMIVWGELCYHPHITCAKVQRTAFTVKYHTKRYMNCVAWGTDGWNGAAAASLEQGDGVLCLGTWGTRSWTNSQGEYKEFSEITCKFVIPGPLLEFMLAALGSGKLQKFIESSAPDEMESAGDFADDESREIPEGEEEQEPDYNISI